VLSLTWSWNFEVALIGSAIVILIGRLYGWRRQHPQPFLLMGVCLALLAMQVACLWFTQSRGPILALLVSVFACVVLYGILCGARRTALAAFALAGVGVVVISALAVYAAADGRLLRGQPYLERIARTFSTEGGTTAQVRALIWEGAWQLSWPHAPLWSPLTGDDALNTIRPLVGYGPDAMLAAYHPFYPPELARVEVRTLSPDRAHNETLDAFVQAGLLGVIASLLWFSSIFYLGLRALGLLVSARPRRTFITLWLTCGIGAALLGGMSWGWHFTGALLPLGMVLGLATYLLLLALRRIDFTSSQHSVTRTLLLISVLSALLAHFVEIQVGIATPVTRLYAWFLAALLIAANRHDAPQVAANAVSETERPTDVTTMRLIAFALVTGLALIVLAFDFINPQTALINPSASAHAVNLVLNA
jgi:hypothetical protein